MIPDILTTRLGIDRLHALQSLALWATLAPLNGPSIYLAEWQANLEILRTPAIRSIRSLTYGVVVDNRDYVSTMEHVRTMPWVSLRTTVEAYPNLERVTVAIFEMEGRPSIGDEVWELIYLCLHTLPQQGIRLTRTSHPIL